MKIALLGGGLDMNRLSQKLKKQSHHVHCFLTLRHSQEDFNGITLMELLIESQVNYTIVDTELDLRNKINSEEFDLVLGLGPAWVISRDTLRCAKQWVNINFIPVPKFMGGAHSTWQILNEQFSSSIVFQEMSFPVDRGNILARYDFHYGPEHLTPQSRFEENSRQLMLFIDDALLKISIKNGTPKVSIDYKDREYWPRLNSEIHGWIDWNWSGEEIAKFVGAFGSPYIGAHTNLLGNTLYFRTAEFSECENIHPFSAGIIIRQETKNEFIVAVRGGHLKVTIIVAPTLESTFLEGLRFHTPIGKLDLARSTNLRSTDL
jgi:methionyl-tRNA formyltransferase